MLIETPLGTWTSKTDPGIGAGDSNRNGLLATVSKVVAHAAQPPSGDDEFYRPGERLFDQPALYDEVFGWDPSFELDFIKSMTEPGRLVEFGCGSGRLLRPLLEHGYEVDGVDSSSAALQHLSAMLEKNQGAYHPRLILGDLAEVALLPSYPAAFAALNTLRCLPSKDAIAAHLRRAAMSIAPEGRYLIHLDSYGADLVERPEIGEYGEWEGFGNSDRQLLVRWEFADSQPRDGYDSVVERVRVWDGDELIVDERLSQISMSISSWQELFTGEGLFSVEAVMEEDDLQALTAQQQLAAESSNYWFVLRRTQRPAPPLYSA